MTKRRTQKTKRKLSSRNRYKKPKISRVNLDLKTQGGEAVLGTAPP